MKLRSIVALVALTLVLVGCSNADSESASPAPGSGTAAPESPAPSATPVPSATVAPALTATELAESLRTQIPSIVQVLTITEDNDPNDLIGRPTGYIDAAIIYDSSVACEEPGASCGATVEIWPDEAAALARSEYIQGILAESPVLGTEYNYLSGNALLRIVGDILPSVATQYETAFLSSTS